ncbi:MAG: hypothetical protein GY913_12370 [Proteobacteria bacterium]|nr:hypothetical protein [Pseudomonadota bacterium]MCP4917711.1 hypothetical protein [Pseudomonadota bacterium]
MADDAKAKDVLEELTRRRTPGDRLTQRLGARRDSAPGHARRKHLFERLGLPDPWDPKAKKAAPPGLGQVALKLSDRRRPAPHAKIRDPNKKKTAQQQHAPRAPKAVPKPPPAPNVPKAAPKPTPAKKAPKAADLPPGVDPAIQRRLEAQARAKKEREELAQARSEEASTEQARRGRFRMRRTNATGPKSRPVPRDLPKKKDEPPPPRDTAPPRRVPGGNSGGLDDLFGFSSEPRMRIPKNKKPESDES